MEDDRKVVTIMSPTSFIAEIMLVLMGLSGVAVVGVHVGYFDLLAFFFTGLGFSVGSLAVVLCALGIYVLLYHDYRRLKCFVTLLALFVGLQLAFIVHLYFFNDDVATTDQEQGSLISLDVCCGLSVCALFALCFHLKQKGSTIEMVKL
jgi:hypothetical protein